MTKTTKFALFGLIFNVVFGAYYLISGTSSESRWLLMLGAYYIVLSIIRFCVISTREKHGTAARFAGAMLIVLSLLLVGIVVLSVVRDRGHKFHMIVMISIALYSFTKITLATLNLIKSRRGRSIKHVTLRNISFADAFVSIFALQRSMLVSFEGMTEGEIQLMNALTGCAVCIIVFLLGLNLVRNKTKI